MMKGITLTPIETTADRRDDDLECQENTHTIQHRAVFVINAMNPDGEGSWESSCY